MKIPTQPWPARKCVPKKEGNSSWASAPMGGLFILLKIQQFGLVGWLILDLLAKSCIGCLQSWINPCTELSLGKPTYKYVRIPSSGKWNRLSLAKAIRAQDWLPTMASRGAWALGPLKWLGWYCCLSITAVHHKIKIVSQCYLSAVDQLSLQLIEPSDFLEFFPHIQAHLLFDT